ncbi:MAG TPA: sulfatase-like hydrolase/transferase, partial [Myxococcaceae bacterium]|nr:sulfatase-like hydrolase/transferase [Myxococcaceae bacterium]
MLRDGSAGLRIELQNPLESLLAAARPLLPSLLLRVVSAYAIAGCALGLAAALLASMLRVRRRWALAIAVELALIFGLLVWDRAIARPALFDDLLSGSRLFAWLVDHGQPWHPRAAACVLLSIHAVVAWRRWRAKLLLPLGIAAQAAATLAFVATGPRSAPHVQRPLIVLIGIDAFRPDRLTVRGHSGEVAPNLEAFTRDAVVFDRAYTPIAQTEPAWRSLLTARWPHRTGVRYPLTPESRYEPAPTFAAALAAAGYRTTFATDCSRFNYQGPLSGFEFRRQPPRGAINFVLEKLRYRALGVVADNALGALWLPEFVDNRALAGIHDPLGYADRLAQAMVEEASRGPALFAYHATAAHFPGDPVYPFYRRFVNRSEPLERRIRMWFSPIAPGTHGEWTQAGAEALYDELLAQADAQLGIILQRLKHAGLYDRALIVIFSDHGESFHSDIPALAGATPVHGARLGDEENRILFAVKLPSGGQPSTKAARVNDLVRLIDVGPTVLELAGLPPLPDADGVSLFPLLEGKKLPPLRLYAETGFTHASPDAFDGQHLAIAPRSFDAYLVRADGAIELREA